jgi:bacteriocin biosynthesis cyclodehydratase domain-containing protein
MSEHPTDPAPVPPIGFMPSTRVLWRSSAQLQLELGPRSVVVEGVDVDELDALRHGELSADDIDWAGPLLRAGFLTSGPTHPPATLPSPTDTRLAPDAAALAARFGDQADTVLAARGRRRVAVHGSGRLPTLFAALLAAAGVGGVHVAESGEVTLRDAVPGGLLVSDEGARRTAAAAAAIARAAPGTDTSAGGPQPADLVILATGVPVPRAMTSGLAHAGQPHLVVGVWAGSAVVGPLVVPGRSSCLQCADLHRRDRDPAWPALAAQLGTFTDPQRAPSDVCIVTLAAALTAIQTLQYLDGERPAAFEGTLEVELPDWRIRRRSWPVHPDCLCSV